MNCPRCGAEVKPGSRFCTACGGNVEEFGAAAPAAHRPAAMPGRDAAERRAPAADGVFSGDKYFFKQPMVAVRDKYDIFDENGNQILYAQRTIFALKRHVSIFAAHDRTSPVLKIMQDNMISFLSLRFTLVDAGGAVLARFRRPTWLSILRRTWDVFGPDGAPLGQVAEDSWGKALFRRFFPLGEFLKTDFNFFFGGRVIGRFIRKFTIRDMYTLDMAGDAQRTLDRRVAVALGILLDSAERR